jgi:RNA polymerase sigma factor (sigma-70 family)
LAEGAEPSSLARLASSSGFVRKGLSMPDPNPADRASNSAFPTTHWTLVQLVQTGPAEDAARAMESICQRYWYPIYVFLRRKGYSQHDAEDLTQVFFAELLTEDALHTVRSERGSLRSYLLGVLQRILADHVRHHRAQKRGSEGRTISLEELRAEDRYGREPQDRRDPEQLFARAWAQQVFAGVRVKMGEAFAAAGRAEVFETLLPFLTCDGPPPSQREIAEKLGASENAVGILVFRLRQTFRELLHEEIAATVLTPEEIPAEMTWLLKMLSNE